MQRVVVDPEVPRDVAELFRRNGPLLSRLRAGRVPRENGARVPRALLGTFGASVAVAAGGLALGDSPLSVSAAALTVLIGLYLIIVTVVYLAEEAVAHRLRRARPVPEHAGVAGALPDPGGLRPRRQAPARPGPAGDRLHRALPGQRDGQVLDSVRNSVMLPAEEWEIARLLTKLSALRVKHRHLARGGRSPEVVAAMAPLERALAASEAAVLKRWRPWNATPGTCRRPSGHCCPRDRLRPCEPTCPSTSSSSPRRARPGSPRRRSSNT